MDDKSDWQTPLCQSVRRLKEAENCINFDELIEM